MLARAWAAGLHGILVPGVGPDDWEPLLALPAQDPRLQVGLGIHPQLLPELPARTMARTSSGSTRCSRAGRRDGGGRVRAGWALRRAGAPLERQVAVLRRHFALARKHELPLLHALPPAHPALHRAPQAGALPEAGVLMHSYSGGRGPGASFYAQRGLPLLLRRAR